MTDTKVFGVSTDPKPGVDGHVLPNPVDPNSYMFMLCYKNGSLTRREVRDRCAGKSWGSFNQYLDDTPPLNGEAMLSDTSKRAPERLRGTPAAKEGLSAKLPSSLTRYRVRERAANNAEPPTERITRQPSESVSEIEPESSGTADSGAHALGDKFHTAFASMCRKMNDSVYELYRPPTADVNTDIDIVFFHGLQIKQDATPYLSTWRSRDAERSLWPSKWLAEDYPTARILSVHYDGTDQARRGKNTFFNNIAGIFFYATPHQGSRLADVEKFDSQEGELVSVVRVHSRELERLNEHFESLDIDEIVAGVGEIVPSDMDEGRYVIVEEASARHRGTFTVLQEYHISICQPRERTNTSYQTLVDFILQVQQKRRNFSEDFGGDIHPLPKTQVGLLASWIEGEINKSFEEHQAIGLWGMGGIGKTTLAKAIFNRERSKFYYTLFVRDVKTFPEKTEREFRKFFLDHTFCKGRKVGNLSDISIFRNKDILVVLDDVEKDRDVEIVTVLQDMCSPKSRYVLTSRDRLIMRIVDGLQIIEIPLLDDRDSEKLFRSIAVPESEEASEEWQEDCLKDIVKYCRGLPLILKVIGQYLETTQEKGIWKETLESLSKVGEGIHEDEVLKKLQVSYDQIGKEEKEMFMDVATIFCGNKKARRLVPWTLAEAKAVWRVVHGNENSRWKILVDRALIYQVTDEDSELKMHEHLQALGRKLARDEGRSDMIHISKMVQEKALYNEKLQQLEVWGAPSRSVLQFAPSISFRKMQNLRYLQVSDFTKISEGSFGSLESLKKLMLECARLERLPDSICRLRELHMMELLNCRNLEELPIDIGCLENIQSLIIKNPWGGRGKLQSLPDSPGNLRNLQRLSVENTYVKELPSSIGDLQCLEQLTVSNKQLQELPASLGRLEKLQELEVGFSDLKEFPAWIGDLESLERLTVCSTRLQGLPSRLGDLRGLKSLVVRSEALEDSPFSLSRLQSLEDLVLITQRLERLPDNWANLKKLQRLDLQCPVFTLPDSSEALPELRRMKLSCLSKNLTGRWGGMAALQELEVSFCRELTSFSDSLGELIALRYLRISSCDELKSLPESVGRLEMLQRLIVERCAKLESLPESLGQFTTLEDLSLRDLPLIRRIPSLHTISSLDYVFCGNLPKLKGPPNVPPKCGVIIE
ncbi:hypothetical protein R1flu_022972 [Riccia fluitans]|uniref:NB-ARC domain-containing protein n=1 Tax=Riccia fluitans TaxID=41844 RepID=A0ABD1XQR7_9MARC